MGIICPWPGDRVAKGGEEKTMFGFGSKRKEETERLRREFAADVAEMAAKSEERLSGHLAALEEMLQDARRQERRRQMALETLLENQNDLLEILRRLEEPDLDALMGFAENFALARAAWPETPESAVLSGRLDRLLDRFGLKLSDDRGAVFDPDRHEACLARCEPDQPDNVVLEVVRPGFMRNGRVLRPATVVVNRLDAAREE